MTFSKENYDVAKDVIDKRRNRSITEHTKRVSLLSEKYEEIRNIEFALRAHGSRLLSLITNGSFDNTEIEKIKKENLCLQKKEEDFLLKHGYDKDYLKPTFFCKKCNDTGHVGIDFCDCLKKELINCNYSSSGLSDLMKKQTFDTFSIDYYEDKDNALFVLNTIKEYAEQFTGKDEASFLFIGGTGLGKTHLSSALANAIINKGYNVLYDNIVNIITDFEGKKFKYDDSDRCDNISNCDLLIIDDLGAEMQTSFSVSAIYSLINLRLTKQLPTIINTNLTRDELRETYNERITSRLFGEFQPLLFKGIDIRRQKLMKK